MPTGLDTIIVTYLILSSYLLPVVHCTVFSSITIFFLLLRVSMFIGTIFREHKSNYSSFKTHQIFIRIYLMCCEGTAVV